MLITLNMRRARARAGRAGQGATQRPLPLPPTPTHRTALDGRGAAARASRRAPSAGRLRPCDARRRRGTPEEASHASPHTHLVDEERGGGGSRPRPAARDIYFFFAATGFARACGQPAGLAGDAALLADVLSAAAPEGLLCR